MSAFNETWNFLYIFSKNTQIPNLLKIPSSWSRVVQCGRTGMTNLTFAFRNLPKSSESAPKTHESEVLCTNNKVTNKLQVKFLEM